MTHTNQAFIHAFGQSGSIAKPATPPEATAEPPASGVAEDAPAPRISFAHGPHIRLPAGGEAAVGKTPLSQAIAMRRRLAAAATGGQPTFATQVRTLAWPAIVEQLATGFADAYRGLAPEPAADSFVLGVAGLHRGSGATTTTMAIARCLANAQNPVAMIDAETGLAGLDSKSGLAASLGLLRTRSIADLAAAQHPAAASLVHAEQDAAGVIVAGDCSNIDANTASQALAAVTRGYALVLIDLGPVLDRATDWQSGPLSAIAGAAQPDGVVLVREPSDLSGTVTAAQRLIESTGTPVFGLVENRATAATA